MRPFWRIRTPDADAPRSRVSVGSGDARGAGHGRRFVGQRGDAAHTGLRRKREHAIDVVGPHLVPAFRAYVQPVAYHREVARPVASIEACAVARLALWA